MDVWDLLRLANVVLSAGLLVACNFRLTRDWHLWDRRERVVRVYLTAYLLVLGYGSAETLADDVKPGLRIVLLVLVHLSFAVALFRNRKDPVRYQDGPRY